ncbi:MAG TPA: 8-oxoguanine deaminase [Elusimicrobiota bacterium]|nr:8-oxoguanine deaminase [Elusimicrobiota bacterium]
MPAKKRQKSTTDPRRNKTLLIKNALLVATMDDQRRRLPNTDIYIEGPRIKQVGSRLKVTADRVLDARDCVVIPGMVNTHHHLYQTLTRNVPAVQSAELFDWLIHLYQIWRNITPEGVYVSAQVGLGELLLTGCTTSSDHFYLFPKGQPGDLIDREIRAAREVGMRFHPGRGSMSLGKSKGGLPPDDVVQKEDVILKDCERLVSRYHDAERFSMCQINLAPCSPFSVTAELLKESAGMARRLKLKAHTHLAETMDEERFCLERFGKRPLDYMASVDWIGRPFWYAHAVHLNDEEIKKMAETKTGAAHCPTSNLRLGSGIAPYPKMRDAGVPVGLGVDGSASNDSSDMLAEARMCLLVHRIRSGVKSTTTDSVLWTATRGGAEVLGRDDIGSIEPGKAADIALFDLNRLDYAGAWHDPLAAILFAGAGHRARWVLVNGEIVVDGGRLTRVDEESLTRRANKISRDLVNAAC